MDKKYTGTLDLTTGELEWDDVETLPDLIAQLTPAELDRLYDEQPVAFARLMEIDLS